MPIFYYYTHSSTYLPHFTMFKSLPKFQNLHGICKVNSQACLSAHELRDTVAAFLLTVNATMSVEKRKQTDIV